MLLEKVVFVDDNDNMMDPRSSAVNESQLKSGKANPGHSIDDDDAGSYEDDSSA